MRKFICPHLWPVFFIFFFFPAEDGIRDYKVTGVQTCALPISPTTIASYMVPSRRFSAAAGDDRPTPSFGHARHRYHERSPRSEERRVGKECRSRWGPCQWKRKKRERVKERAGRE